MSSLTPQFFDGLVIAVIVVGLLFAARRIRNDFRKGPRWPEDTLVQSAEPQSILDAQQKQEEFEEKHL